MIAPNDEQIAAEVTTTEAAAAPAIMILAGSRACAILARPAAIRKLKMSMSREDIRFLTGGLAIHEDRSIPKDEIQLRNPEGTVVLRKWRGIR